MTAYFMILFHPIQILLTKTFISDQPNYDSLLNLLVYNNQ